MATVLTDALAAASAMPDSDALVAYQRAFAFAIYGRGQDAVNMLAQIDWEGRAPVIQGIGLSMEGVIELLCRRNVSGSVERCSKSD